MTSELQDAREGLAARLATIAGLRVLDYPAEAGSEFPVAMIALESRDAGEALAGSSFAGRLKVVLVVSSASTDEAYDTLDQYLDPVGASSLEAAVDADNTWGGKVDDGRLALVDNVGPRRLWGGVYVGADLHFRFIKHVAT